MSRASASRVSIGFLSLAAANSLFARGRIAWHRVAWHRSLAVAAETTIADRRNSSEGKHYADQSQCNTLEYVSDIEKVIGYREWWVRRTS